jgi:RNA polymerase-binding transcription factor DksA
MSREEGRKEERGRRREREREAEKERERGWCMETESPIKYIRKNAKPKS